jgi:hypothetical protein
MYPVLPPFSGGLHCGNHPSTVTPPDSGGVFSSVDGGLHCGYLKVVLPLKVKLGAPLR